MAKMNISQEEKKMQARWDLDTLRQAEEIKKNNARMKAAQGYAQEQIKALGGIVKTSTPTRKLKK
jgi:FtsZ-binding cell division protein ZapB